MERLYKIRARPVTKQNFERCRGRVNPIRGNVVLPIHITKDGFQRDLDSLLFHFSEGVAPGGKLLCHSLG
jgi:hypothetical protein